MNQWKCALCGAVLDAGMFGECPECSALNAALARVVHHANLAWNVYLDDPAPDAPYDALPEWHRQMITDRVVLIRMGYDAAAIHEEWVRFMTVKKGWQLGDVKDPAADPPVHPCLKEWRFLPAEQRRKDTLAIAVVKSLTGEFDDSMQ